MKIPSPPKKGQLRLYTNWPQKIPRKASPMHAVSFKQNHCFSPICHGGGSYKCSITEKFSGNFFQFLVTREKNFLGGNICCHAGLSVPPTFRLSRGFSTNLLTPSFSIPKFSFLKRNFFSQEYIFRSPKSLPSKYLSLDSLDGKTYSMLYII